MTAAGGGKWPCPKCRRAKPCVPRERLTRPGSPSAASYRRNITEPKERSMTDFQVRIGVNPLSWMNDDLPSLGGETPLAVALTEGRAIGYEGFELGNKFPREPAALKALLAQYDLALVSGWYSGRLAERSAEQEIEAVGPHLDLLA